MDVLLQRFESLNLWSDMNKLQTFTHTQLVGILRTLQGHDRIINELVGRHGFSRQAAECVFDNQFLFFDRDDDGLGGVDFED
jgi:hypothetical protein